MDNYRSAIRAIDPSTGDIPWEIRGEAARPLRRAGHCRRHSLQRRGLRLTVADERLDILQRRALIEQIRHHQDAEGMRPKSAREPRRPEPRRRAASKLR